MRPAGPEPTTAIGGLSAFAQGSLDAAFSARRGDAPAGTAFTKLADGGFVCVMPGDRLAEKPSVSLEELAGESLIFLEDSCCPPEMRDARMNTGFLESARKRLVEASVKETV